MIDYNLKYSEYKSAVEAALHSYTSGTESGTVEKAARYSLLAGGKRVRGVLSLAVTDMLIGSFDAALPVCCAVEAIHAYSLIHDDLPCMDNDDLRRGKPSCHIAFGEANALLAGDGLLTLAFEILADVSDAHKMKECVRILAKSAGMSGMILGQELDIGFEGKLISAEDVRLVNINKTGRMISAPIEMGAVLGGASTKQKSALLKYAENIGIVFQIIDDILDLTSSAEELGKNPGSDEKNQKSTYATIFGLDKAYETAKTLTDEAVLALEIFGEKNTFLKNLALSMLNRKI